MTQMQLGATESREAGNRVYVNLRTGKISEVSKDENENRPGFKPFTTENKSGTKYHFFAKTYDDLTGFIKDIKWNEHKLEDGTRLAGWNLFIDAGDKEFVLQIQTSDRPYQTLMQILPNVDFERAVRIVAFMGKNQQNKPQKVLLMTQNADRTEKDWIKPALYPKWLSRHLMQKLKEGVELTEEEKRNVAFNDGGKPDNTFPYIKEKSDGSWSFDAWNEHLFDNMESEVLPRVSAAQNARDLAADSQVLEAEEIHSGAGENEFGSDYGGHVQPMEEEESIPF